MDVTTAVRQRISTRAFLDKPISKAALSELLETAQRSPSGGNLQPWRVIALAGQAKDDVVALAMKLTAESPRGEPTERAIYPEGLWEPHESRRKEVGEMMYAALGIPREDKERRRAWFANNFRFFGAPVALFFVIDERMGHGQWAHTGMYAQTIALLAEERGWGSCLQECWGLIRPTLKRHLELKETEMVWSGMALGWPDKSHPVNTLYANRARLEEVVEFRGF